MKWLFLLLALLLPGLANAQNYNALSYTAGSFNSAGCGGSGGVCYADLSAFAVMLNGTMTYCKDCQPTNPCAGNGSGAMAQRIGGSWLCATAGQVTQTNVCGVGTSPFSSLACNGPVNITANSGNGTDQISNVSVNGLVNVKAYGAKGDGIANDTAAVQAAVNAAGSSSCVYFPSGSYSITNDINLTCSSCSRCLRGADMSTSIINCNGISPGSMNACLDFSGADNFSLKDLVINGTTAVATAPKTLLLLARVGNQGFGHSIENVYLATWGSYTIYDFGAELAQWHNVRSNSPTIVFSSCNSYGMTSKFQTLTTTIPTSMSAIYVYGGSLNGGGGKCAVMLDDRCPSNNGVVHDVFFYSTYFGEFSGGGSAVCDNGLSGDDIYNIGIIGSRMEASDSSGAYSLWNSNSYNGFITIINSNVGTGQPLTQPAVQGTGYIDDSQIEVWVPAGMSGSTPQMSFPGGRGNTFHVNPAKVSSGIGPNAGSGTFGNTYQWFDGLSPFWGHSDVAGMSATSPPNTVTGPTAGSIQWNMPMHGASWKQVLLTFINYQNNTATAQTITYPQVFGYVPTTLGSCPAGMVLTNGGQATLPVSMASAFSGQCVIAGQ